ncbi:hypothetical protein Pse7367_1131 [Thalassoporum mexicanum PCC 7367]|nr:hypothetical protein Pse7367_1131 [Pseudanabaena sp. PCC 7367]
MVERLAGRVKKTKSRFWAGLRVILSLGLTCLTITSCIDRQEKVPVFIFTQVAPDGTTIDTLVPSDLVAAQGSLTDVINSLPEDRSFQVVKFGESRMQFQAAELSGSQVFGEIATFQLPAAITQDNNQGNDIWQERNLLIVPSGLVTIAAPIDPETEVAADPTSQPTTSRRYTCPSGVQSLVLDNSRALFLDLGARVDHLPRVAVSSVMCLDIDNNQQAEIVAGLRLDNINRPSSLEIDAWQRFLQLPIDQRWEYSMLVMLRRPDDAPDTWLVETIATHSRALAYTQDSVGSFALFSAHDLDGDDWLELAIVEIGLDTVEALVLTSGANKWQWQSYYQPDRPLDVVQKQEPEPVPQQPQ